MISASATATMIRKFPISNIAFWAWLTAPAPATSLAVRPKNVSGRDDDALHLALLDDAARIGLVADLLRNRQGFAGQRRLVDGGVIATNEPQVGGHDDAEPDLDDV